MKNEYKSLIISAVLPLILSLLGQFLFTYFFGDEGKVQIINSVLENETYQTIISIKNMKQDEYLKDIEVILDSNIEIISAEINGIFVKEELIFKEISPNTISTLIVISEQELTEDDITIVKNGSKITIENFNKATNYKIMYLVIAITYFIINFVLCIWLDLKNKKVRDEINKQNEEIQDKADKCEMKLQQLLKEEKVNKTIYLKEMNDMEKEVEFYQQLILKCVNKEISKTELETIISKELKTFTRKKMKHLSYSDIYKIINDLSEK